MTDFGGTFIAAGAITEVRDWPGRNDALFTRPVQFAGNNVVVDETSALAASSVTTNEVVDSGAKAPATQVNWLGTPADYSTTPAIDWFEKIHIIPRSLAFGNILTTQTQGIEPMSAYRKTIQTWDTYVNNGGSGISLLGAPSLSADMPPLVSLSGISVEVTTVGPPSVNSTLDFGFSPPVTISIPITLERVILWPLPPELPYGEFLEFKTDVFEHKDGSEQRVRVRKNPRQSFEWDIMMVEGPERSRINNLLFGWQSRNFGLPIWHELTHLTVAASAGATTINVTSTDYADYRTTGSNLVLVWQDATTFDVQPLSSLTSTTLTFSSPLNNAYAVNVKVMPLRVGVAKKNVRGSRQIIGMSKLRMQFRVTDNDISIGDVSAFSSYNGKALLDGYNGMSGKGMSEMFRQDIIVIDNETGLTAQDSPWTHNRHGYQKTFLTNTRQDLWETRQLVHALGGKQTSFYLPTFVDDLELIEALASGGSTIAVTNVGYTTFVEGKEGADFDR